MRTTARRRNCPPLKTADMPAGIPDPAALPPAGSMRWYAWLFASPAARPLVAVAFALEMELRSIPDARVDHGVAHLKLQWWREEFLRLEQGRPRHPLTQSALNAAPDAGSAWQPMQDLLSSLELDLACATYETEAELDRYFALADGLQRVVAAVPGPTDARVERFASATGQAARGIEIIRDLRKDAVDGRVYLPLAWLDAEGIDHNELRAESMSPGARRCLTRLAAKLREQSQRARQALIESDFAALRGQIVFLGLHTALLDQIEREQFEVGRRRHMLGPMQSLWTAWRVARQH